MNVSCMTWMNPVARSHEWVMYGPCMTWMSHVTRSHVWSMYDMNESSCALTWMGHVWHEWVMSHDMNESWMSAVARSHTWVMYDMNEVCDTWVSHGLHEKVVCNELCHTPVIVGVNRVIHTWNVWHMNESRRAWESRAMSSCYEFVQWVVSHTSECWYESYHT